MEPETEAALAKAQAEQDEATKRIELECERAVMLLTSKRDKELLRSHHESEAAIEQAKVEHKGDSAKLKAAMTKIWQDAVVAMETAEVDCNRECGLLELAKQTEVIRLATEYMELWKVYEAKDKAKAESRSARWGRTTET